MNDLYSSLSFKRGPAMKNRFMLAPLTNSQSHEDGSLSDDEFHWLTKRAEGGFGLTMTCAAHVQIEGKGFPGQLGIFSDDQLPGLTRLASKIKEHESIAIAQLYHGGMRCPSDVIGMQPVSSSDSEKWGARAMTTQEVETMISAFVTAAARAEKAGFDGVELHGAHGYLLAQFLSPEVNKRTDRFGGSLANRSAPMFEIIEGIRSVCGDDFMIGMRLSPERFGMDLGEVIEIAQKLMKDGLIEFLDMSLWDVFKEAEAEEYKGQSLLSYFSQLERGDVRLGVAGKIMTPDDIEKVMGMGIDWVMLGKAGILHHDYPNQLKKNPNFVPATLPVSADYLRNEGLSDTFVEYMKVWKGFVKGADGFVDADVILNS